MSVPAACDDTGRLGRRSRNTGGSWGRGRLSARGRRVTSRANALSQRKQVHRPGAVWFHGAVRVVWLNKPAWGRAALPCERRLASEQGSQPNHGLLCQRIIPTTNSGSARRLHCSSQPSHRTQPSLPSPTNALSSSPYHSALPPRPHRLSALPAPSMEEPTTRP